MGHFYSRTKTFINLVYFHRNFIIQCFPNSSCIENPFVIIILEELQTELQILQGCYGHKRHSICAIGYFNTLRTGDADLRLYITNVQDG